MLVCGMALSLVFTGILIPQILLIAFRKKLFDEPDGRKIHHSTVPRLGGIAFEHVILFSFFILLVLDINSGRYLLSNELQSHTLELSVSVCSLILLYLVGIADDLVGVKYRAKFVVQITCGILFLVGGLSISDCHGILGIHQLPSFLSIPFSIVMVVFIINAINLIDGIDGLASGLSGVALLFYTYIFYQLGEYLYALISITTLGTIIPFFYYNVFGNPEKHRKIFMGDSGSLTIGLILCLLSFKIANLDMSLHPETSVYNPLVLAFIPLMIPCMDVVHVFIHRVRHHKNPFLPDKNHIHHKLLRMGMSQRSSLLLILVLSALFMVGFILLSQYVNINIVFIVYIIIYTGLNCWMSHKIKGIEGK
ncbi:MAG: undecaprenyl/decaprenyl-phosphate alpha-N-acetylglucosaminyl 1-phosphate transferase [Paludibacteraceae bacterium]|nr:undecaprenyl/decaprenyl-phosphate alpha-N-acetylglucosaminyl 1-phosphate transferase [Paludibacteraceae bacterium]